MCFIIFIITAAVVQYISAVKIIIHSTNVEWLHHIIILLIVNMKYIIYVTPSMPVFFKLFYHMASYIYQLIEKVSFFKRS